MSKTLVVDINELYRIIPEAKKLEGKNFKDVRELLKDLIGAIESSGQWQFIQYVNNKPSLFVIREEIDASIEVSKLQGRLEEIIRKADVALSGIPDPVIDTGPYEAKKVAPAAEVYSNESFEETSEVVEDLGSSIPITKLPWEN